MAPPRKTAEPKTATVIEGGKVSDGQGGYFDKGQPLPDYVPEETVVSLKAKGLVE